MDHGYPSTCRKLAAEPPASTGETGCLPRSGDNQLNAVYRPVKCHRPRAQSCHGRPPAQLSRPVPRAGLSRQRHVSRARRRQVSVSSDAPAPTVRLPAAQPGDRGSSPRGPDRERQRLGKTRGRHTRHAASSPSRAADSQRNPSGSVKGPASPLVASRTTPHPPAVRPRLRPGPGARTATASRGSTRRRTRRISAEALRHLEVARGGQRGGTGKSMQLLVAWASRRSSESRSSAWASAVRRPLWRTVPMARILPVSTVTGRRNFKVRSSEV